MNFLQTPPPRHLRCLDYCFFGARPATPQCSSGVDAHCLPKSRNSRNQRNPPPVVNCLLHAFCRVLINGSQPVSQHDSVARFHYRLSSYYLMALYRYVSFMRICNYRLFCSLPHFSHIKQCTYRIFSRINWHFRRQFLCFYYLFEVISIRFHYLMHQIANRMALCLCVQCPGPCGTRLGSWFHVILYHISTTYLVFMRSAYFLMSHKTDMPNYTNTFIIIITIDSFWRRQANGLPQTSVLAPTLFVLYTSDLPVTRSCRFFCSDISGSRIF